jgi:hypothetical protein
VLEVAGLHVWDHSGLPWIRESDKRERKRGGTYGNLNIREEEEEEYAVAGEVHDGPVAAGGEYGIVEEVRIVWLCAQVQYKCYSYSCKYRYSCEHRYEYRYRYRYRWRQRHSKGRCTGRGAVEERHVRYSLQVSEE